MNNPEFPISKFIRITEKDKKYAENATVVSEVQNEARRYLEYEIDF